MPTPKLLNKKNNSPNSHFSKPIKETEPSVTQSTTASLFPETLMTTTMPSNKPAVSCSLKRKRPPKIQIPDVLREVKVDTQFRFGDSGSGNDVVCFDGDGFGVCSVKGKKKFMEDSHKIVSSLNGNPMKGFFGVYDGHGGRKAADFVAKNLHTNILDKLEGCKESMEGKMEAVRAGYLKTDEDFLEQGINSGACCVTALIEGREMIITNLGDCRAVLCRGGVAEALTNDHRAEEEEERKRIVDKGGYVEVHRGAWRVHGILSVSRSIGDAHLKQWVLAEPDTKIVHLTPDMEFLVLASDGLWEKVGNQEATDTVLKSSFIGKKHLSVGHTQNADAEEYTCISLSPSPKVRRISLVKQQKTTDLSPSHKKTTNNLKEALPDFDDENECRPPPKVQKVFSQINQQKTMNLSPCLRKTNNNSLDEALPDYDDENECPPSKVRRVSVVKQHKTMNLSPSHRKATNNLNEALLDFDDENKCPPSKVRKISLFQKDTKFNSPSQENKNSSRSRGGHVASCKELVNLAASRGSMDDITVIIVDLKHFKSSSS